MALPVKRRLEDLYRLVMDDCAYEPTLVLTSRQETAKIYQRGSIMLRGRVLCQEEPQFQGGLVHYRIGPISLSAPLIRENNGFRVAPVCGLVYEHCIPRSVSIMVEWDDKSRLSFDLPIPYSLTTMNEGETFEVMLASGDAEDNDGRPNIEFECLLNYTPHNLGLEIDRDHTDSFLNLFKRAEADRSRPVNLAKKEWHKRYRGSEELHFVLVRGLFTNHYPGYFMENAKLLERLDLDYSFVPLDTEGTVESNALMLRDYLIDNFNTNNKKFVIMTHSKGGLDTLEYLRTYPSEATGMIHAIINIQCPFFGSPAVDMICHRLEGIGIKDILGGVFDSLCADKGKHQCILEFSYEKREPYMERLVKASPGGRVTDLFHPIKFITLASFAEFRTETSDVFRPHDLMGKLSMSSVNSVIETSGHRSDGLGAQQDSRLPGSDVILLPDCYHSSQLHMLGNAYHSGDLTDALLSLLFELYPLYEDASSTEGDNSLAL